MWRQNNEPRGTVPLISTQNRSFYAGVTNWFQAWFHSPDWRRALIWKSVITGWRTSKHTLIFNSAMPSHDGCRDWLVNPWAKTSCVAMTGGTERRTMILWIWIRKIRSQRRDWNGCYGTRCCLLRREMTITGFTGDILFNTVVDIKIGTQSRRMKNQDCIFNEANYVTIKRGWILGILLISVSLFMLLPCSHQRLLKIRNRHRSVFTDFSSRSFQRDDQFWI